MNTIVLSEGQRLASSQLPRQGVLPASIMESAQAIIAEVQQRKDDALRDFCLKFDGVVPESFSVDSGAMDKALECVDPAFLAALEKAADQIRDFHERELAQSWFTAREDGTILGVKVTPVPSAGIYVPGGRAQYPSTVLMNAVPAKVAGVKRIVMVTPPQKDGGISPYTLAAAKVAGVDEIYAVGGAQAIAALAYGTQSIPRVAKITGPGNAYVAAAKRLVSGDAGIDMVAGPSEVCVLVDSSADATVVAADLMAQAEHDPLAACYLVTCDPDLRRKCRSASRCLSRRARALPSPKSRSIPRAWWSSLPIWIPRSMRSMSLPPSTWSCTAKTPWVFWGRSKMRAPSSSARGARSRSGITWRVRIIRFPRAVRRFFPTPCRWRISSSARRSCAIRPKASPRTVRRLRRLRRRRDCGLMPFRWACAANLSKRGLTATTGRSLGDIGSIAWPEKLVAPRFLEM